MELQYSNKTKEIERVIERLKKMTLAFKIIEGEEDVLPALVDGSKKYLGIDKMNIYLDQLDREKEQWYYCDC